MSISWRDFVDVLLVTFVIYRLLLWMKGTRAFQLTKGLLVVLLIYLTSKLLGFQTIDWLLEKLAAILIFIIIVVFQPELRKMLESLGRARFFRRYVYTPTLASGPIQALVQTVEKLAQGKVGSLIVIEKEISCKEYLESGIYLDAKLSSELLLAIFNRYSPLHDGATFIQGKRIVACSCLLPLSENRFIDDKLGTRHRAAIGLTEKTDALVIVISEETGTISLAENGILNKDLTPKALEAKLLPPAEAESPPASEHHNHN